MSSGSWLTLHYCDIYYLSAVNYDPVTTDLIFIRVSIYPGPGKGGLLLILKPIYFIRSLFKCLVAWCHSFCLFFIFYHIHTYIHSYNHIHPSPFAEASLHFFIACLLSGGTSLWCRAENRTRACLTASQRATNWATPHHSEPYLPCNLPSQYWQSSLFTRGGGGRVFSGNFPTHSFLSGSLFTLRP